jgi:hypothetical protein
MGFYGILRDFTGFCPNNLERDSFQDTREVVLTDCLCDTPKGTPSPCWPNRNIIIIIIYVCNVCTRLVRGNQYPVNG